MATPPTLNHQSTVCRYNKFGFCRFKEVCRKRHFSELCVSHECDVSSCEKRHPKKCKYHMQRRCKFGLDCMFVHIVEQNVDERMDDKVKQLENEIKNKTEEINEQNNKICELESKLEKFLDMNQQMSEKNDLIESLLKRIDMMEERMIKIVDDKGSKLEKLINKTGQLEKKVVDLEDALIVTENSRAEESQSQ